MSLVIKLENVTCCNRCCIFITDSVLQTSDGELVAISKNTRFVAKNGQLIPESTKKTKQTAKKCLTNNCQKEIKEFEKQLNKETLGAVWEDLINEFGIEFVSFAVAYLGIQYVEKINEGKPLKAKNIEKIQQGIEHLKPYAPIIKQLVRSAIAKNQNKCSESEESSSTCSISSSQQSFEDKVKNFTKKENDSPVSIKRQEDVEEDQTEKSNAPKKIKIRELKTSDEPSFLKGLTDDQINELVMIQNKMKLLPKNLVKACEMNHKMIFLTKLEAEKIKLIADSCFQSQIEVAS